MPVAPPVEPESEQSTLCQRFGHQWAAVDWSSFRTCTRCAKVGWAV